MCGCVMSPISGIYWIELGFINNYKEPQLWLVLLRYSAYVARFSLDHYIWYQSYALTGSVGPTRKDACAQKGGGL